jgi:hypothetical protein
MRGGRIRMHTRGGILEDFWWKEEIALRVTRMPSVNYDASIVTIHNELGFHFIRFL